MSFYFGKLTEPLLLQTYAVLFFVSFILCLVIILSSGLGFSRRAAVDEIAVQSAHKGYIPRVGGLAIYISILGLIPLLSFGFIPVSVVFDINAAEVSLLILSSVPVFLTGLAEDLGYEMKPKTRLVAAAMSSFLAILFFKIWLTKLGIPGLDSLLSFAPLAIAFTIFSTVGVVNSFNLIDGLNGFSSYVAVSIAIALSIIFFEVGNLQMTIFLILLTASVLGFTVLNFPYGKIFLGDGGAYVLGHLLVWSAIILVNYDTDVSPFAIFLIFFWPVADTGLAIWRRWSLGDPTYRPDRLHFHQLVMRFLEIRFLGRDKRQLANPIATIILIPLVSVPQFFGVVMWKDFAPSVWVALIMTALFIFTYIFGVRLAKSSRGLNG